MMYEIMKFSKVVAKAVGVLGERSRPPPPSYYIIGS